MQASLPAGLIGTDVELRVNIATGMNVCSGTLERHMALGAVFYGVGEVWFRLSQVDVVVGNRIYVAV